MTNKKKTVHKESEKSFKLYIKNAIEKVEKSIGYTFKNKNYVESLIIHPSVKKNIEYERMEFLGDRVLAFIIVNIILNKYANEKRELIALRFVNLVNTETLWEISLEIGLNKIIKNYSSDSKKTEANNCEVLIGALFLDGGLKVVKNFIRKYWKDYIDICPQKDARGLLQEYAQGKRYKIPVYNEVSHKNENNCDVFEYRVFIEELNMEAYGTGTRKRNAASAAAENMLKTLEKNEK